MESFDPDYMNKMASRERISRFVPIEEVPDKSPDPSQALIMKEDALRGINQPEEEIETSDPNDIARPLSYSLEKFEQNGDLPDQHFSEGISEKATEIVDKVEENVLKDGRPSNIFVVKLKESHGKRGRKPGYKDKIGPALENN